MATESENPPKSGKRGEVLTTLTAVCGDCSSTVTAKIGVPGKEAAALWKSEGWKNGRTLGWICPECCNQRLVEMHPSLSVLFGQKEEKADADETVEYVKAIPPEAEPIHVTEKKKHSKE